MEENQEQQLPSKEEYLKFMEENIEVAKLRSELQNYQTRIAVDRAEELKALMFIAQVTGNGETAPGENEEGVKERKLARKNTEQKEA